MVGVTVVLVGPSSAWAEGAGLSAAGLRALGADELRATTGGETKWGYTCGSPYLNYCAQLACAPVSGDKCEHIFIVFGFQTCRENPSTSCETGPFKCCIKRYCERIDADCQNAYDCNGLYTTCYAPTDCSAQFPTKCGIPYASGQCGP